jgi:HSP20 family protein
MAKFGSLIPWRDKAPAPHRDDERLDPFLSFRREVDRLFDDVFSRSFGRFPAAFGGSGFLHPTIDVEDNEKELVVTAELPGLEQKDFEVTLSGDLLTIKGEKKDSREEKKDGATYVERRYGSFSRSVRLPFEAGDQKVEADYDKGVLTIRVPKPAELVKPARRIEVKSV